MRVPAGQAFPQLAGLPACLPTCPPARPSRYLVSESIDGGRDSQVRLKLQSVGLRLCVIRGVYVHAAHSKRRRRRRRRSQDSGAVAAQVLVKWQLLLHFGPPSVSPILSDSLSGGATNYGGMKSVCRSGDGKRDRYVGQEATINSYCFNGRVDTATENAD